MNRTFVSVLILSRDLRPALSFDLLNQIDAQGWPGIVKDERTEIQNTILQCISVLKWVDNMTEQVIRLDEGKKNPKTVAYASSLFTDSWLTSLRKVKSLIQGKPYACEDIQNLAEACDKFLIQHEKMRAQ